MAVVPMSKVRILLHQEYRSKVLELLHSKEVMQITDTTNTLNTEKDYSEKVHEIALVLAEIEFALSFLADYAPQHSGFDKLILGEKVKVESLNEVDFVRQNFDYKDVIEKCKALEAETNRVNNRLAEIDLEVENLTIWNNLKLDLNLSRETSHTKLYVGEISQTLFADCILEIEENATRLESKIVDEDNLTVRFWLLVEKGDTTTVDSILQKYSFKEFESTVSEGTPSEAIRVLNKEKNDYIKELEILTKEQKRLAQKTPELKILFDDFSWRKEQATLKERLAYTTETASVVGFVSTDVLSDLEKSLTKVSNTILIEEISLEEGEDSPVKLKNNKFVKPFEGVMKLFGLPSSKEADPTPYLTPFFLVFFGFCLTDVGYGLILGLGLLILLKTVKFPKEMKGILTLLMYAGWSTMVMGILFGGYLGLTVDQAPAFLVNAETGRFKFQIFDPINNINAVMAFAYGLGLIQLWLGTLLKGLQKAKTNKWNALQSSFSYNILILLIIFLSLSKTGFLFADFSEIIENLVYINIIFAIWGSGYETKNIIARPFIGAILFLQEIISIFSGVLSYSRLFALGLSTGIIALVFNTIALTAMGLLPVFVAIPAMIIIIIIGHTLNIALNVLGAFIHSARLQFVEFFGTFLQGGGEAFQPFKKEMKYISLQDK